MKGQAVAGHSEMAVCGAVPLVVVDRGRTGGSERVAWKDGSST